MDMTSEVKGDLWTVPAIRMKGDRPHFVPLTAAALAQLPFRPVCNVSLSNCIKRHTNAPATTHGMRSTFRENLPSPPPAICRGVESFHRG